MFFQRFSFSFILILCLGISANSFEVPRLTGPVVDEAGLLNSASKNQLEENLYNFLQKNGVQIQLYIAASLQDEPIESVSIKVFDQWKIGDEKYDKGVLFLIAPKEKKIRIEVGQGLEGDLPDVIAKRIIADIVAPYFRRAEYSLGIMQGVSSIQSYILHLDTNEGVAQVDDKSKTSKESDGKPWLILVVLGVWFIIFLINPSLGIYILMSALNSRGGSGGSGRGGWSGGGGRSSGGGASGGW